MNKKRILGTVILVVLIVILFLIIKNANQSPYDYLKNKKIPVKQREQQNFFIKKKSVITNIRFSM